MHNIVLCAALLLLALPGASYSQSSSDHQHPLTGILKENGKRKLTFNKDSQFKVISFSDMHFGERWGNGTWADWGPEADSKTQNAHGVILDEEKPDFVVFNGDIVTGENLFKKNATKYLDQCFAPTVERGIPFSSTHGNHDNSNNINHQDEIEYEMAHYSNLSYTRSDAGQKPYGLGNYWLPVYQDVKSDTPSLILWFFDSRSFVNGTALAPAETPQEAQHYWVDEDAVPPYINKTASVMRETWGQLPPSLAFVHIPIQKADLLYMLPSEGNHDDEPDPATQGFLNDSYTGLDLPFFYSLVGLGEKKGKLLAIVSGHDHGESWCARSKDSAGLVLCFDGHSGHGGYTTPHSKVRNGRVFSVQLANLTAEWPSVETWNSYENKTTNDRVILNKNYMASNL